MRVLALFSVTLLVSCITLADSKGFQPFFIPEELQTILSLVYSRLPPIKLGSDKRFGVGFRIGRNADAQILVELGPQSETQPLGGGGDSSVSKRESRRQKYKTYKSLDKKLAQDSVITIKTTVVDKLPDPDENQYITEVSKDTLKAGEESKYATTQGTNEVVNNEYKVTSKTRNVIKYSKTADPSVNVQENAVDSNTPTTPEPMINIFMKWLTRFSQTNVNTSST